MTGEGEFTGQSTAYRVGEELHAAREHRGMTLEQVAQRTRIPLRHLAMIEQGSYDGLPAATYSAGFVKSYARLVGLDGGALSDRFRQEIERGTMRPSRPEPYEPADPRRTPPLGLAILALLVAMVLGVGFLYWRGSSEQPAALAARGVPAAVGRSPAPAPAAIPVGAGSATAPAPASGGAVLIGATQDVWVRVTDGSKTVFQGTLAPGKTVLVPADAIDPRLTTGRPGNTTVSVGATRIPSVGAPDRAAHGVSLKPDALLARMGAASPAAAPVAGAPGIGAPVAGSR